MRIIKIKACGACRDRNKKMLQNNNTPQQLLQEVDANISFPQEEEKVLAFWKDIDAFKTSVKMSEGKKPYSFYDGPPFATGYVVSGERF